MISDGACGRRSVYELAVHTEEEELKLFPAAKFALDDDWVELETTDRLLALPSG